MTASQPSDIFQPDDVLNNTYRIESILGRGGTSEVYKARSEISGRVMAVKALRAEFASNDDFLALMTREEDIRDVRHDAIVRYFDTQRMPDGVVYLVMEHVDGPGLDQKLREGGIPASDLMIVGQRVCEGLIEAHRRNIVHRDLSPDNIILRNDDPADAVIIDFGIAKDTNPGAETIVGNEFAGKYAYAAPEQLAGNTDARSDIYSLGALLLSTFRGKKPDIGNNPMEVVQRKAQPLDLEGVPDPLGRLIAKMAHPDPNQRFQTAQELLQAFRNPEDVGDIDAIIDGLDDATVIVPVTSVLPNKTQTRTAAPAPTAKEQTAQSNPKKAKGNGGIVAAIGIVLAAAIGAGVYFSGILGPATTPTPGITSPAPVEIAQLPVADPYALIVQRQANGQVQAIGNVPNLETQSELSALVDRMGGVSELELASGEVNDAWGAGMLEIVRASMVLDEFRIAILNDRVAVTGKAKNASDKSLFEQNFANGFPIGFSGTSEISVALDLLETATVQALIDEFADCGPLKLFNPPNLGYGPKDRVFVIGRLADASTRSQMQNTLTSVTQGRPIQIETEILNPSLCQIDTILPRALPGGFNVRFGYGDTTGENVTGRYFVNENPVIDVRLPEDVQTGHLWVSVVDVQGFVFHLLPNRTRPNSLISDLRRELAPDGYLRLAYGIKEAGNTGRLAFTVDGSVLGKSKVIVIHSDQPLFDQLRPTTESAEGFAQAVREARDNGRLFVRSMDSAVLTTQE